MSFIKEFKDFALKGNIVDLAVAVIIGGAFGTIISSFVDDVITPLILTPALQAANVADLDKLMWGAVKYGKFLASVIKFFIIAFAMFLLIKANNKLNKKEEEKPSPAPPAPSTTDQLLAQILEALKK